MAALMILIVSMVALVSADTAVDPHFTPRPAYVHANKSPANSVPDTILSIPLSVVATSDDHADDRRSAAGAMHKVMAKVVEKVIDVVTDVREKVADAVDNMRDKVADFIDDAKAGSSSRDHDDVVYNKNNDNSNETKTDESEEADTLNDNSEEVNGGDSAEKSKSSRDNSKDNDKKIKDDVDDSKNREKSSTEVGDKQKDDSMEEISSKDKINGTDDSGERENKKDENNTSNEKNKDDESSEKGDGKSVWSFLKDLTGDIENESADDDTKVRHYLTRISKFRGYMDAMDSNFAVSLAKQSGTCPVYPIQVGNNRVTITTENGCKIIIKLKGLTVDKIEDGHEEKRRAHKRSILVSYSDN